MEDRPEQETIGIDRLIALIDQTHKMAKSVARQFSNKRETSFTLMQAIKQLEIANHFANSAKALEEPKKDQDSMSYAEIAKELGLTEISKRLGDS